MLVLDSDDLSLDRWSRMRHRRRIALVVKVGSSWCRKVLPWMEGKMLLSVSVLGVVGSLRGLLLGQDRADRWSRGNHGPIWDYSSACGRRVLTDSGRLLIPWSRRLCSDSMRRLTESTRTQWRVSLREEKAPAPQQDSQSAADCSLPIFLEAHRQNRWMHSHGEDLAAAHQLTTFRIVTIQDNLK